VEDGSCDVIVSALVLNFVPDRKKALSEMQRVARSRATVAFYVWDYPGGGMEMMRAFWSAAVALDPSAADLSEDRRFPFCTADGLRLRGLLSVSTAAESAPVPQPTSNQSQPDGTPIQSRKRGATLRLQRPM
jgi:SAM-dependent methyltransferase